MDSDTDTDTDMDIISGLATLESRRIRKFRDAEEERADREDDGLPSVPLLHITRSRLQSSKSWCIESTGEAGHDNEDRMQFLKDWLSVHVLGSGESEREHGCDPSGTYRIELHDSYTYLPRAGEYRDVLSFGRGGGSQARVALLPDPYQASSFGAGAMLGPKDTLPWARKTPTVIFAGSTTGDRDAIKNERVRACIWALAHPNETNFRITSLVQMHPYEACLKMPRLRDVLGPHVPPQVHFRHRFIANIVGNTACWSRVPMVLRSNSVLFQLTHDDIAWYYPLMHAGEHYVPCDSHDDILIKRLSCMADDRGCVRMAAAGNRFFERFLTVDAATMYARQLLYDVRGK